MFTLAALRQKRDAAVKARDAQAKIVEKNDEPRRKLAALEAAAAEEEAAYRKAEAAIGQLEAERTDMEQWVTAVAQLEPQLKAMIDGAERFEVACATTLTSIDIGLDNTTFSPMVYQLRQVLDELLRRRARIAAIDKQIKTLRGE